MYTRLLKMMSNSERTQYEDNLKIWKDLSRTIREFHRELELRADKYEPGPVETAIDAVKEPKFEILTPFVEEIYNVLLFFCSINLLVLEKM